MKGPRRGCRGPILQYLFEEDYIFEYFASQPTKKPDIGKN